MSISNAKIGQELESSAEWQLFVQQQALSDTQAKQFAQYMDVLLEWNKLHNLTAITKPSSIISSHFQDSLELRRFVDLSSLSMIADIGSGGGFPGIPLKIIAPHLHVILIEVAQKKIAFLEAIISSLGLDGIEVYELDWRTFLRTTSYPVDLFTARASLNSKELVRMFKPGCPYQNASLVYWASIQWEPDSFFLPFVKKEYSYRIKSKKRKLVLMKKP